MVTSEDRARERDERDPGHRELFHIPAAPGGRYPDAAYFAGNSLGLQPRATRAELLDRSWTTGRGSASRGTWRGGPALAALPRAAARAGRPAGRRAAGRDRGDELADGQPAPADGQRSTGRRRAAHADRHRGQRVPVGQLRGAQPGRAARLDPDEAVVRLRPRPGETTLRTEDVVAYLAARATGSRCVLLGGVNYLTGELLDIARDHRRRATRPGRSSAGTSRTPPATCRCACTTGASTSRPGARTSTSTAGRARWPARSCTSGTWPTARCPVRGLVEHRPGDPVRDGTGVTGRSTRPTPGSCPTRRSSRWRRCCASLEIFDAVGHGRAAGQRSRRLTGYLEALLDEALPGRPLEVITPRDPDRRGAQLSLRVGGGRSAGELAHAAAARATA